MSTSTIFCSVAMWTISLLCVWVAVVGGFLEGTADPMGGLILGALAVGFACMGVNEVRREIRNRKPPPGFEVLVKKYDSKQ